MDRLIGKTSWAYGPQTTKLSGLPATTYPALTAKLMPFTPDPFFSLFSGQLSWEGESCPCHAARVPMPQILIIP